MTFLRIVAPLLVATAALAQLPAKIEQPKILNEVYRVDLGTGALVPLESIDSVKIGSSSYRVLLPGLESSVAFKQGERLVFAIAGVGRATLEEERSKPHARLERLVPKSGEKGFFGNAIQDGRYATKVYVPLDISLYGEPVYGLDSRRKDRPALTFLYTPSVTLPPGEYAFSPGLLEGHGNIYPAYAFRIVRGAAAAPPPAAAPAPPPQPRRYVTNIDEVRNSAQQGYATAQLELGSAYASGSGVLQDYVEAYKWLNIAAARLDGMERYKAATLRDEIAARMTSEQVAQAQKAARDWMEEFQRR